VPAAVRASSPARRLVPFAGFVIWRSALADALLAGPVLTIAIAAIRIEGTAPAHIDTTADAAETETSRCDADDSAIATVRSVATGIDAAEIAADLAAARLACASGAIPGAALAVVGAGPALVDTCRFARQTGAGVQIEGLPIWAVGCAGDAALHGAAGAGAKTLVRIGTHATARTAVLATGDLRRRAIRGRATASAAIGRA